MDNLGRIITDFYCNGFFGGEHDLFEAIIVLESETEIVVRTIDGKFRVANFEGWAGNKQYFIDKWVKGEQ